uniref:ADMP n=1 Tax=Lottia goshimai TaxID=1824450 RepID=A0A7D5AUL0_9GAST|nr:ADMP [Lottia goshimai]
MIWSIRISGDSVNNNMMKWCVIILVYMMLLIGCVYPESNEPRDPIDRLSRLFGISKIPAKVIHRSPPQYMVELFKDVTDAGGLTKQQNPYNANIVRSFPDKDSIHRMHFHYNVSHLSEEEKILHAEFRVFKMRPKPASSREASPPHVIQMSIYQVLDIKKIHQQEGLRLLDKVTTSAYGHGWQVFQVIKAVNDWRNKTAPNYGFLITTTSRTGDHVNGSYIRFAQRNEHHDSKQPILVVYTDDGTVRHPSYISAEDDDYMQTKESALKHEQIKKSPKPRRNSKFLQMLKMMNEGGRSAGPLGRRRKRRSARSKGKGGRKKRTYDVYSRPMRKRSCTKQDMYVDFDEIGWSGWIISPKGYNANHCTGTCPFPLGQSQKPTNHATVQSIVYALGVGKSVETPCCVPNKLYSISLLYFDDDENVILKQYDDMVAATCGCH